MPHFLLTAVSGTGLIVGLYFLLAGNEAVEPVVAISSMGFYAAAVLFAFIAIRALWFSRQAAASLYSNNAQNGQIAGNQATR